MHKALLVADGRPMNNLEDLDMIATQRLIEQYPVTLITAKGPNVNISTYSSRNNVIPRIYPQPVSVGSATLQRPGTSCSPSSVRSLDTYVGMSVSEIVFAINNATLQMNDIRVIKDTIDRLHKKRLRERFEKQRLAKLLHMSKQKSGTDSGEEGSESSISNDDCGSITTAPCVANYPKNKSQFNISNFKKTDKENYMYTNHTENIKINKPLEKIPEEGVLLMNRSQNVISLPTQRFNKISMEPRSSQLSNLNPCHEQSVEMINAKQKVNTNETRKNNLSEEMQSKQKEIFSEITTIEKTCEVISSSNKQTNKLEESNYNPHKEGKDASMQIHKTSKDVHCLQNDVDTAAPRPLFDNAENSDGEIELIEKGNNDIASVTPDPSGDLSMQPSFMNLASSSLINSNIIKKNMKSVWDTDTESELENCASSRNLNYTHTINDTVDKSINAAHVQKVQDQKTECMSIETKAKEVRNKTQKGTKKSNVPSVETRRARQIRQKRINTIETSDEHLDISMDVKENATEKIENSKSQIRSYDINSMESSSVESNTLINVEGKPTETCNTAALSQKIENSEKQIRSNEINTIESSSNDSHISINVKGNATETCKMGNPKRQVKPKTTNTVKSPLKNSKRSNKEKGTLPKTSKGTTLNHTTDESKSQVKSKKKNPVNDNSESESNITKKSLRSYKKKQNAVVKEGEDH